MKIEGSLLVLLAACSILVSRLAYYFTLKMEAICFPETSVELQRTARLHIPEDKLFFYKTS
jgi:hypothetical protein